MLKPVKMKSGSRDTAVETRQSQAVQNAGGERAKQVQAGLLIGSECTNETEPYIVSLALAPEQVWAGEDDTSWMGRITAGEWGSLTNWLD